MIVLLALIAVSGAMKAVMDTLQFHFHGSIFSKLNRAFYDPQTSWINKYADKVVGVRKKWNGIIIPVLFTDAYHLFQSFFLTSLFAAVVLYVPMVNVWVDFIILRTVFGVVFYIFYTYMTLN